MKERESHALTRHVSSSKIYNRQTGRMSEGGMFTLCQSATAVCHLLEKVRVGVVFVVGEAFADLEVAVLGLAHGDRAEEHSLQDLASRLGKSLRVRAAPDARQTQPLAALNTDRSSRDVGERYSHRE